MKKIVLFVFLLSFPIFSQIAFDMDFESGNLKNVTTSDSVNYTVTTIGDVGGRWFYFRITGVKDKFIRVDIPTSDVNRPLYSYDNIVFTRFSSSEAPQLNRFEKEFDQDTVFVAYYVPYTFTHLMDKINKWKESNFVTVDTIGYTPHDLPIQEVMITDSSVPDSGKHSIWIHARTHPGETPSSYHFEGIVEELLNESNVSRGYLQQAVFHLIPFTNPDGVYYGRSRTNFDGVDLERDWNYPDNQTTMEVRALKARMTELTNDKVFSVFLNLHSQASSSCTMFIHTAESTNDYFYRRQYQFAYLNASDNPDYQPSDFNESNLQSYFPEGWLWNNFGDQVLALTYETPYDHYTGGNWVTNDNLRAIGARTLHSVTEFLGINDPERFVLDNDSASVTGDYNVLDKGLEFFGNDYIKFAPGDEGEAIFTSAPVKPGIYSVYAWWDESSSNSYGTEFIFDNDGTPDTLIKTQKVNGARWNYLMDVKHNNDGPFVIKVPQNTKGNVVADAFRVVFSEPINSVKDDRVMPGSFSLEQNFPNPFNPSTTIRFEMKEGSTVKLEIFNSLGERVEELVNGYLPEGMHEYIFNAAGKNLASGVYYYSLSSKKESLAKGMVLLK